MAHLHSRYPLAINHVIRSLIAQFGVEVRIFRPLAFNNGQHGRLDEDITFDFDNPIFTGKVLIPSIYDLKIDEHIPLGDLLYSADDSNTLLVETTTEFPKGSKIVLNSLINKVDSYLINDEYLLGDDELVLFRKYLLVPYDSLPTTESLSELTDIKDNDSINLDDDLLEGDASTSKYRYNPLIKKG